MIRINYFNINGEILDTQEIEDKYNINKFSILGKLGRLKQSNKPLEFDMNGYHIVYDRTEETNIDTRPSASTDYYKLRKELETKSEEIKKEKNLSTTGLFTLEERIWLNKKKLEFLEKYF